MAFLRVNNLDVSALVDSFDFKDATAESYTRSPGDSLQGITYTPKKQIGFSTDLLTDTDSSALEGWVRGRGHLWTFERVDSTTTRWTLGSSDGGLSFSSSNATLFSTGPKFGTWCTLVTSGGTSTATATFGSDGDWTISAWAKPGGGSWTLYTVRSLNGVVDRWVSATTAATVVIFTHTAASGYLSVTLRGRDNTATSTSTLWDQVMVVPYAMTPDMISARNSATIAEANFPYVNVSGDALPMPTISLSEPGPITCKGFLEKAQYEPVVLNNAFEYNARKLDFKLVYR